MQLKEVFYYALFTISVTATCARADNSSREILLSEKQPDKRLSKREAAIFVIDSFPGETVTSLKPKRFYKRRSKQRYQSAKPRNVPQKAKQLPPSQTNKKNPFKKYKVKKVKPIYSSPAKKQIAQSWVPPSKPFVQSKSKHVQRAPNRPLRVPAMAPFTRPRPKGRKPSIVYSPLEQEPMGFGEPPADYRPIKQSHQEVPVDSYGAPLKINDPIPKESTDPYENYDMQEAPTAPDYGNWNDQSSKDNNVAFSNNFQAYAQPSVFAKDEIADEFNLNSYVSSQFNDIITKNKKRLSFTDLQKLVNKPWRKPKEEEGKVLVGGQYAEPPGRYIPTYHSNENIFFDDSDRFSPGEMDTETTMAVSPYVNYKNSNMAFSPQNLNDAFSIDK